MCPNSQFSFILEFMSFYFSPQPLTWSNFDADLLLIDAFCSMDVGIIKMLKHGITQ